MPVQADDTTIHPCAALHCDCTVQTPAPHTDRIQPIVRQLHRLMILQDYTVISLAGAGTISKFKLQ
jgi:hypothetical protein